MSDKERSAVKQKIGAFWGSILSTAGPLKRDAGLVIAVLIIALFSFLLTFFSSKAGQLKEDLRQKREVLTLLDRIPPVSVGSIGKEELVETVYALLDRTEAGRHLSTLRPEASGGKAPFLEASLELRSVNPGLFHSFLTLLEKEGKGIWLEEASLTAAEEGVLDISLVMRVPRPSSRRQAGSLNP